MSIIKINTLANNSVDNGKNLLGGEANRQHIERINRTRYNATNISQQQTIPHINPLTLWVKPDSDHTESGLYFRLGNDPYLCLANDSINLAFTVAMSRKAHNAITLDNGAQSASSTRHIVTNRRWTDYNLSTLRG